jgi:long-chain acyl-CoA synthetase
MVNVSYADRPWLSSYDAGVPKQLDFPVMPLHQILSNSASKYPTREALVSSAQLPVLGRVSRAVTYAELERYSDALAVALVEMGVKKGDRIAIVMPNTVQFAIAFFATLKAGGVVAAANPTYPDAKLAHQISDCNAKVIITLTLFYDMVKRIQPETEAEHVIVTNIKEFLPTSARVLFTLAREKKEGHRVDSISPGDYWLMDLLGRFDGQKPTVKVTADDLAIFQYTGGTTGVSKAAMSRHSALVANMFMVEAFLKADNVPGQDEVTLAAIPLFHVYGMVVAMCLSVYLGGKAVMIPNPRDVTEVLAVIDHFKPSLFPGVPALYNAINNHPDAKSGKVSLKSLRVCISGSAPLPPATKREFEALSGGKLIEGFGMSEAPTATHVNPIRGENRVNSIGVPLPEMDMRIVSLDDGETDLQVGDIGELLMAGPNLMVGYHGMPTETKNSLRQKDGKTWLYTGDIARMDERGYFYIVDRKKDMALIGGFNVYPNTVEKVLQDHPAVLEVGVAAIPHPEKEGQEALKAWIVLQPGKTVTEQDLIAHCEKTLAQYEIPRRYVFIDELPKSTVGKTLRRELVRLETEG